jgi:20S proteasome alpha/beta subunit
MTLIVALACKDAIVLAADSQATEMQGGPNIGAAIRHDVEKIWTLGPNMLWAASGSVGIIQDVSSALDTWAGNNPTKMNAPIRRLKPELVKVVAETLKESYGGWFAVPGQQNMPPTTMVLICGRTDNYRWILEISENGMGELKEGQGFASLGSAYNLAAVAAAMVSEYAAPTRDINGGELLALRVLETAVRAAAFGVGGEPKIGVIDAGGARILEPEQVQELQDRVEAWKRVEAETLGEFVTPTPPALVPESTSALIGAGAALPDASSTAQANTPASATVR